MLLALAKQQGEVYGLKTTKQALGLQK